MNVFKIRECLDGIVEILEVNTDYDKDNNKLNYNVIAIHKKLGKVEIKFSTIFNLNNMRFDTYGILREYIPPDIKADINQILVVSDNGSLITIEEYREKLTKDDIEKRLGYKIEIVDKN